VTSFRPRILVIDDEPQIHRFLTPALEAAGYEAIRADTGEAGLRELALRAPDAVVLDLGLPDMDGKDALRRARQFYEGPVLILSARIARWKRSMRWTSAPTIMWKSPLGSGRCWPGCGRCSAAARTWRRITDCP